MKIQYENQYRFQMNTGRKCRTHLERSAAKEWAPNSISQFKKNSRVWDSALLIKIRCTNEISFLPTWTVQIQQKKSVFKARSWTWTAPMAFALFGPNFGPISVKNYREMGGIHFLENQSPRFDRITVLPVQLVNCPP